MAAEEPEKSAVDEMLDTATKGMKKDVIVRESILLNQPPVTKEEAIRKAGELLVARGAVEPQYIDAMLERERLVSTYMGMGIAIPHGTSQAKGTVKKSAMRRLSLSLVSQVSAMSILTCSARSLTASMTRKSLRR